MAPEKVPREEAQATRLPAMGQAVSSALTAAAAALSPGCRDMPCDYTLLVVIHEDEWPPEDPFP